MIRVSPIIVACTTLLAAISVAHANNINFNGVASDTAVTNQYPGVVFSLQGGPDSSGPPTTDGLGVVNAVNADSYPTANILNIAFTTPVSGLSFTFNNYGTYAPTTYTAYGAGNNIIATGNISTITSDENVFGLVTVSGSGIVLLQINNGLSSSESWIFSVQQLTFTPSTSVPTLSEWGMLLLAVLLAGAAMLALRRRRASLPQA